MVVTTRVSDPRRGEAYLDPVSLGKVSRLRREDLRRFALRRPDHNSYFPPQSKSGQAARTHVPMPPAAQQQRTVATHGDRRLEALGVRRSPEQKPVTSPGCFKNQAGFYVGSASVRTRNAAADRTQEAGRVTCVLTRRQTAGRQW